MPQKDGMGWIGHQGARDSPRVGHAQPESRGKKTSVHGNHGGFPPTSGSTAGTLAAHANTASSQRNAQVATLRESTVSSSFQPYRSGAWFAPRDMGPRRAPPTSIAGGMLGKTRRQQTTDHGPPVHAVGHKAVHHLPAAFGGHGLNSLKHSWVVLASNRCSLMVLFRIPLSTRARRESDLFRTEESFRRSFCQPSERQSRLEPRPMSKNVF